MDSQLNSVYWPLRVTFGAVAFLAGLDKFFNILTHWEKYVSPLVLDVVPFSATLLMKVVGVIEMAAGLIVLSGLTRFGGYLVAAWLTAIAVSLLTGGEYLDVAVRDVVMAVGAFTLARVSELRVKETVSAEVPRTMRAQPI